MKLTAAQKRVLDLLEEFDVPELAMITEGIQRRVMEALRDKGLVRFMPYANPPRWTRKGMSI